MVRETRHLWVGNLPENVREDRIRDHFKRYGRVQSVKVLAGGSATVGGGAEGAVGAGVGGGSGSGSGGAPLALLPASGVPSSTSASAPGSNGSNGSSGSNGSNGSNGPCSLVPGAPPNAGTVPSTTTGLCAAVAFIDIMSAAKAHAAKHLLDERLLTTVYYEPAAIPSAASASSSPASSQYSTSSGSAPTNNVRYASEQHRSSHQRWYNNYATSPTTTGEPGNINSAMGAEGNAASRRRGRSGSSSGSGSSSRSVSSSSAARSPSSSSSRASSPGADHRRKHQWPSSGSSSRPLAICVRNLPQRSSDSSLKDGLFHEYKKHGKVSCVKVVGVNQDRYAVVYFKKPSDVEKALEVSQDKSFFGCKISVGPYQGVDVEDNESRPYETDLDEFHPKATRTLFIGNLEKDVNATTLREKFKHFGKIIEIDIKKPSGGAAGYAFCQFASISSVVDAMRNMDGELVGGSRVKLGFGKSMATNCIWIDGVSESSEKQVLSHCLRIGPVSQFSVNGSSSSALVIFEQVASAQQAVKELRGLSVRGKKLQVDFASRECQEAFFEQAQKQCNNSNPNEPRCINEKFLDGNVRNFDSSVTGKYNRYDSSPRTRPMSYSRSRISRLISQTPNEHFDNGSEFSEKRFRYDEFSGGSGSEAAYDISGNTIAATTPALQSVVVVSTATSVPPPPPPIAPTIRNLHKERVHLLEQLEECPSSGDELVSPKKRFKNDRASLSRRPSVEISTRHHRDISPCSKRRRSSVTSRHHWHTTSPISRPGTPLHDERPDSPVPTEPRRLVQLPRRSVPMSLPLPRFAAQILARVAPSSPPRPPPGPPPPASPTAQRVPSPASSPGSSPSPAEPSFDERIRSLDERYEKWSGSRTLSISECSERSRFRHHLLDLDVNEVQPSEVMRSVLAKRSVFDEDSKRLESICDKYEVPIRTVCAFPSPSAARVSPTPLNSPQSAGRSPFAGSPIVCTSKVIPSIVPPTTTPAKGLQYPFPSHPPLVPVSPLDGVPLLNTQTQSNDCVEDSVKNVTSEKNSANHLDAFNIPRNNNNNISVFNDRVPVSVSFSSETANSAVCVQSLNNQKTQFRNNNKFELMTKNSELKSPSHIVCNLVNSSEFELNECDVKSKSSNINSDTLDRRKVENLDNSQLKFDSDLVIKDNKDSSIKPKIFYDKVNSDKKNCEKSNYLDHRVFCEKTHLNEKSTESIEKRRNSKDDRHRIFNEKDMKNEKRKRDDLKFNHESSIDNMYKPIDRLQPNEVDKSSKDNSDKESNEKENFCREVERGEKEQIEKVDKDRYEKEKKEKEKLEKERLDKDRRDKDRVEQHKEYMEKEIIEKEKVDKERREKEKLEKDRKERDRADKERLEREKYQKDKTDRYEREKLDNDKHENSKDCFVEKGEKFEKFKDKEKEHKKKEDKEHYNDFVLFKERKKEKDDHVNDRHRHKESYKKEDTSDQCDIKNSVVKSHENKILRKLSRDDSSREYCRKDSSDSSTSRNSHDSTKSKDSDFEIKEEFRHSSNKFNKSENRNRFHEKELSPKINGKDDPIKTDAHKNTDKKMEVAHISEVSIKDKRLSLDDKQRHHSFDSHHNEHKGHESKRKERLNSSCSLPANITNLKRRVGSHENLEHDDCKKPKIITENRKLTERRDSRDSSKYFEKSKHSKLMKSCSLKSDDKFKEDKRRDIEDKISKTKDKEKDKEDDKDYISKLYREKFNDMECKEVIDREKDVKDVSKIKLTEKIKPKRNPKEIDEDYISDIEKDRDLSLDKEFLARLELRSSQEDEKQLALKRELKEKKRIQQLQQIQQLQMQQSVLQDDKKIKSEERRRDMKEKRISTERKSREENVPPKTDIIRKKSRKLTNSSDTSDSDEPKKHSIFDIVDDGPTYISMYDKVKARSCKNMQKQEEEKRQEKIKAKFCQLKQSRAKREEKKRSASWDEDSDSDHDHKKSNCKSVIVSSSEDESQRRITTDSENEVDKFKIQQKICDEESIDDAKSKLITRKNSRTRIMSDTSEDEAMKKALVKIEVPDYSDINHEDSDDFDLKNSKLSEKENRIDIKVEPINDIYAEKHLKSNDKCMFDYNSSLKDIDDKNLMMESKNSFIKNEMHYVKNEENYKFDTKYCDDKYTFFPDNHIISDVRKNNGFSDIRKKHKKKQKRQKIYPSDDEGIVIFEKSTGDNNDFRDKLNSMKRRHSNKKDKKRDKLKLNDMKNDDSELRSDLLNFKREAIMKDIFGPLSDECDEKVQNNFTFMIDKYKNDDVGENVNTSDSLNIKEKVTNCFDKIENLNESSSFSPIDDDIQMDKFKEELKRRKEKKRKERKSMLRDDENSLDVDAAGKAIEASLCNDLDSKRSVDKIDSPTIISATLESDVFRFTDGDDSRESPHSSLTQKNSEQIKKDIREKKKKKKKNKEDRQNKKDHYHHNHRDKKMEESKNLSDVYKPGFITSFENEVIEVQPVIECKPTLPSPSLPRLTDSPPLSNPQTDSNFPPVKESSPKIVNKQVDGRRLSDKFIPGFGVEIDETISENAVKSISEFDNSVIERKDHIETNINTALDGNIQKSDDKIDEKPRAVISQEETEDAVAALLGESFGSISETFTDCYAENTQSPVTQVEVSQSDINEVIADDEAEEMRQAVQNINESEIEIKPETPQSENDLQIDTDTDSEDVRPENHSKLSKTSENQMNQQSSSTSSFYEPLIENKPDVLKEPPATTLEVKVNICDSQKDDINSKVILDNITPLPPKISENIDKSNTTTVISKAWSMNAQKPKDQSILIASKDDNMTSILHLKPVSQPLTLNRPILTAKIPGSYQVLNQIPRPTTVFNTQNPTIKTHDHVIYQGQPSIMISPRMAGDIRLTSPKVPQHMEIQSKVSNLTILAAGPPSLTPSSANIQQKCPNQITVLRVQQPPLSPIQTTPLSMGNTKHPLLSPNHQNAVIIQNQNLNRISMTPVITLSKPNHIANVQQSKPLIQANNATLIQQSSLISKCDVRKSEVTNKDSVMSNCNLSLSTSNISAQKSSPLVVQNILLTAKQSSNPVVVTSRPSNINEATDKEMGLSDRESDDIKSSCANSSLIKSSVQLNDVKSNIVKSVVTSTQETSSSSNQNDSITLPSLSAIQSHITPNISSISKNIQISCNNIDDSSISNVVSLSNKAIPIESEKTTSDVTISTNNSETIVKEFGDDVEKNPDSSIGVAEIINQASNNDYSDKPKCDTDFEELLKQTSIITKIEKPVEKEFKEENLIKTESIDEDVKITQLNDPLLQVKDMDVKKKEVDIKEENDVCSKSIKDSVIKKVDTLPVFPDVVLDENKIDPPIIANQKATCDKEATLDTVLLKNKQNNMDEQNKFVSKTVSKRGGRTRNKKNDDILTERIQTRQGNKTRVSVIASRRGRGRAKVDKRPKAISTVDTTIRGDVYDFHEDSGDEIDDSSQNKGEQRPRLILTIKSPVVTGLNSNTPLLPTLPTKEANTPPKSLPISPVQSAKEEKVDDFQSPASNTRKSRRLLEKDVTRNSVDDVIEDVVKNTSHARLGTASRDTGPIRRSARQNIGKASVTEKANLDLRKSPRSIKKAKDQKSTDVSIEENLDKNIKKENTEVLDTEKVQKIVDNKISKSDQLNKINVLESVNVPKKSSDKSSIQDICSTQTSNKNENSTEISEESTSVITSTAESVNNTEKAHPAVNISTASKITDKLPVENSEELILDPVTGELIYVKNNSDEILVATDTQSCPTAPIVNTSINSRVIVETKSTISSISEVPSLKTVSVTNTTSTVKTITPNIHATSRVSAIIPTSNVIATTTNILPATQSALLDIKIKSQTSISEPKTSVNKNSQSESSVLCIPASAPESIMNTVLKSTVCNVSTSSTSTVSVKCSPITSVPLSKSNGVSTISVKPVISHCNSGQNIQPAHKVVGQVNLSVPLNKSVNPTSPSKVYPNIQSKLQVAQQPKPLIIQPQLAHPPLKQIQAIHTGQAGALGPGTVGPSLPRGAQGQHSSPPLLMAKHLAATGPQPVIAGANSSRVSLTAIPSISPQGQVALAEGVYPHFVNPHYQQYIRTHQEARTTPSPYVARSPHGAEGSEAPSPPLDRRLPGARVPHPPHSPSLGDRNTDSPQVYSSIKPISRVYIDNSSYPESTTSRYYEPSIPPPAHTSRTHTSVTSVPHRMIVDSSIHNISKVPIGQTPGIGINIGGSVGEEIGPSRGNAPAQGGVSQTQSPPGPTHASHAPREADSLMMLLRRYPVMWQGLLALKNDAAAVQMHFVHGNPAVAGQTLPHNGDGSTPPLRIAQRMRLEPVQLEAVARKMQMENEHCMLLALPCGRDHLDVLQQSTHLSGGFITYLRRKQAAGIVNVAPPGHHQALFTVHIFPSCDFANENLERIAPDLLHRVADIAHLLIVIATV